MKNCFIILFLCSILHTYSQTTSDFTQLEQSLLPAVQVKGEPAVLFSIEERMDHYHVPGVSIAIIQDGKIAWAKGYGVSNTKTQQPVDEQTLFQAGSISKPVAAMGALTLVQKGKMDLDEDINTSLSRWKVPESPYIKDHPVTLEGLLSHTAGMTVHGFPGYTQSDEFPTVEAVLLGEGNTAKIFPDTIPGSIWRYSGGGYTVAQLAVEEVADMPFAKYLEASVLAPLGMTRSTYLQPLPAEWQENVSAAFNSQGEMAEGLWNNYPELAAAGLWTTPTDLAKFCIAIQEAYQGNNETVLSQEMVQTMLTSIDNRYALGLGIDTQGDTLFFGHGGKNRGFTNNMRASATHGMGIIVMTNADEGGNLTSEIMRGVMKLFNWGPVRQQTIVKYALSPEDREGYLGTFQLDWGDEEYFVEIRTYKSGIVIHDPQNTDNYLLPVSATEFVDRDSGRSVSFTLDEEGTAEGFLYAGTYPFKRSKK